MYVLRGLDSMEYLPVSGQYFTMPTPHLFAEPSIPTAMQGLDMVPVQE
jgi:hypothetical protein